MGGRKMQQPDYREQLEPWVRFARSQMIANGTVYGLGDSGHWSIQAHCTALAAFAALAADPLTEAERCGCSRDELAGIAGQMLRFVCEGHRSGGGTCRDGRQWGHGWISGLGVDRAANGVGLLERAGLLDTGLREQWTRMLRSEADWLLDEYPVEADIENASGRNKPESNIWNGCILLRAAQANPQDARAAAWRDKATRFLINGISVPSDAASAELAAGRPVSDWHVGANFTESMGLNHHGYLNVGYMVICLSNLALLHLSARTGGWTVPEAAYHHAAELWGVVRRMVAPDGRLLRIGGDSRARYCYCQEYLVPVLLLARDRFGEDCTALECGWLEQVRQDAAYSGDGSFLGGRLRQMRAASRVYYLRLEGDRAATLALGAQWRRELPQPQDAAEVLENTGSWEDRRHGAVLERGRNRFASWTWDAAQKPQGLFLPQARGDMAEWRRNLAGEVTGDGGYGEGRVLAGVCRRFAGGFVYDGRYEALTVSPLFEGGEEERVIGEIRLAGAALPDDQTWIGMQYAVGRGGALVLACRGLNLLLPNDVFNGFERVYDTAQGVCKSAGLVPCNFSAGDWLCADGALWAGRLYGPPLRIENPGERSIELKSSRYRPFMHRLGGSIGADAIRMGGWAQPQAPDDAETLFDVGYVLRSGRFAADGLAGCRALAGAETGPARAQAVRAALVRGGDGEDYLFVMNVSLEPAAVRLPVGLAGRLLRLDGAGEVLIADETAAIELAAAEAALFVLRT